MKRFGWLVLGFMLSCAGEAPQPEVAAPKTSAVADDQAVEPTASASAEAAAPQTAPVRTRVDMSAALGRLPKDAAVYGMFRPVALDTLIDWAKNPDAARRELGRLVPSGTILEILTSLGVDPGVPVAFAVAGPDLAEARKLVDDVIRSGKPGPKGDPVDAAFRKATPNGTLIRFVIRPATPGRDTTSELERISEKARLRFVRCPDAAQCAELSGHAPMGLIDRGDTTIALYKRGDLIEIDWLESHVIASEGRVKLLAARRDLGGGPTGSCSALDSEADASFCVDGTRAGDLGAALGLLATAAALQNGNIDPPMRRKIAEEGKKEALVNLALAAPKRKLIEDGTLSVSIAKGGYTAAASFRLAESAMASVVATLGRETCANAKGLGTELVPALQKGFGDPGGDFKDWNKTRDDFRNAGFGSLLIAFGRIWPNMLGFAKDRPELASLPLNRVCARANGDRLELRAEGAPLDLGRL